MTELMFTATAAGKFSGNGLSFQCALGKGGVTGPAIKTEGDGASPLGIWPMRRLFYRADRLERPQTGLACIALRKSDGWCDAPQHRLYNRPVTLPFAASHEKLWREDHVYDLLVELGYNDDPVEAGKGSAIFFHLAREDYAPTEGCIALAQADMLQVLRVSDPGTLLVITL